MVAHYANEQKPPQGIPPRNMGAIPVFVRLAGGEYGEHWRTAIARRWTTTHAMVSFEVPGTSSSWPIQETLAWLSKDDVGRIVPASEMRAWLAGQREARPHRLAW